MKQRIVYSPQPDITIYELALVLKVFTYGTLPSELKTDEMLLAIYEGLPTEAKRHFKLMDLPTK